MGLFKWKRRTESVGGVAASEWRGKIGVWFSEKEKNLADYLNQKTLGFSFRCWLTLLVSFCGVIGGYLLYLLLGIFN